MVLPLAASIVLTGFGPMLQPLPSTSEYSCKVTSGRLSPTLIMCSPGVKKTNGPHCGPSGMQSAGRGLDRLGLLDQARGDPVLGLGDRAALGDLDHVAGVEFTLLVVRVVLARLGNDLAVELVLHAALDE